ncbi:MAG TPA: nitrogenase component 1 [Methanoregulaceae archaeon]|nr:MAG: nitrogenase associated protein [Methanolinea sp.]HON82062.1 nitrogenase component 1 [Methanoregulaceae archaeon]HPD10760.1 nitrogenase component 1 [Methanoregulaceae archaeon]HRT15948.1 nitrogenase component 1 [Methanoregulaceae archaeon]HRU31413.1 nitrogenase component 1 [Methanoregulaceae archaeon]
MDRDFIVFHGNLQQLLNKVETGELIPKLQASHAPMCKFFTAYYVISGIRHVVPLVHGPTGCPLYMSDFVRTRECCEIRGIPLEPTACTTLDESHVIYGGEGKLLEAVQEAYRKYHPDLIVILSCCCSGIIGDDVESIAREAERLVGCRVLALRSEGFGGDFRSGYEDAFRLIMELMEPPKTTMKGAINILGARWGPPPTEFDWDIDEIERLLRDTGIRINAVIAGGCTVDQIRHAREVELNASWCYDWGQKLGDLMQERFGIPYSKTGQPYGLDATKEWLLGVAGPLGREREALEVIKGETRKVEDDLAYLKRALAGKTAIIEISEFPGPIRALSLARMAEEFGAYPVVINVHPYTIKERMPSIKFILETGINPEIILTRGLFHLGSFRSSKETEDELEAIVRDYDDPIFFGNAGRFPPCPVVNLTLMNPAFQPQYGFRGITNIAALVRQALENNHLPRSRLLRGMLYGPTTK